MRERVGEFDAAESQLEVSPVNESDSVDVLLQGCRNHVRQDGHAILAAFALTDRDPALVEIDVFDS